MNQTPTPKTEYVVVAECIGCKAKREIRAGEVDPLAMPMCKCGNVMLAVRGKMRRVPKGG